MSTQVQSSQSHLLGQLLRDVTHCSSLWARVGARHEVATPALDQALRLAVSHSGNTFPHQLICATNIITVNF
ncbi:hypothetical protein [Chromatium okenii]|jgi:hypothetical protein|uniref:hypothetical protein n=1 Tax=Chromatium okenii TaxID=61644 RepID=UPI0026F0FF0A|nr:hypothetical protein [Chromatium okenii]MBV5310878.1 hypothetical protein [Chromatium okenii]